MNVLLCHHGVLTCNKGDNFTTRHSCSSRVQQATMNTCTSCFRKLPAEAFVYEGKTFKTCSTCLGKRRKKANRATIDAEDAQSASGIETLFEIVDFQDISDYVAEMMTCHTKLAFDLHIKFDDEALTSVDHDAKLLAKAIVDMVEDGDGYSWV
jgi:hypothetical protein